MLAHPQPGGIEKRRRLFELLRCRCRYRCSPRGRAADVSKRQRRWLERTGRDQEEFIRLQVVNRDARGRAVFGEALQRLALPRAISKSQREQPVADVVERGDDQMVSHGGEGDQRRPRRGLEEHVDRAITSEKTFQVGRQQAAGRIGRAGHGPRTPQFEQQPLSMHRGRCVVRLLDLHESPVTAEEHLARVEGLLSNDEVAFEAGREVAPGGHAHVVWLAFVDNRRGGKRRAAGPFADGSRVAGGGERSGAEVGGDEQTVGIAPGHPALGLGQREAALHECLLFEVELPHHVGVGATAGERHEAATILRLEHGRAVPDPVFPLLHRKRIEVEHGLPGRLRLAVFVERRPPPQPLGVRGIPPDVVEAVADLRDHRNPLLRVEDAADPCLEGLEPV